MASKIISPSETMTQESALEALIAIMLRRPADWRLATAALLFGLFAGLSVGLVLAT